MKRLGRPKIKGPKKVGISVAIYPDLLQRITTLAEKEGKSVSSFINDILEGNIRLKYYNDPEGILRKRK